MVIVIFLFNLIPVNKESEYLTVEEDCLVNGRVSDIQSTASGNEVIVIDRNTVRQ